MKKALPKTITLFLLICLSVPTWAGTEVKAHLESYSYKKAWVDLEAFITDEHLKMDFLGPWSHGSLIYDRDTSFVTVVDDLHKTILPLSQDNQAALKLIGAIASSKLQDDNNRPALQIARENAQTLFNGVPALRGKGLRKEGFTCDRYRTELEGNRVREVWVTSPEQAGMKVEDYNTLRGLAHLVVDLCGDELTQWGADTGPFRQDLYTPQLPVFEVLYAKGKPSSLFQILRIQSRDFDPTTFNPPASYQTLSLLDLLKRGLQANP